MARVPNRNRKAGLHAKIVHPSNRNRGYGMLNIVNSSTNITSISEDEYEENENEIYELKQERLKLLSRKVVLKSNLSNISFKQSDLEEFVKFFPDANYFEIEKIDEYHKKLTHLLEEEIKDEIETIESRIEDIDDEIEELQNINDNYNDSFDTVPPDGYAKVMPNTNSPEIKVESIIFPDNHFNERNLKVAIKSLTKNMNDHEKIAFVSRLLLELGIEKKDFDINLKTDENIG